MSPHLVPPALRGIRGKARRWTYLHAARLENGLRRPGSAGGLAVRNLLVIHMQAAGDMLLAVPALAELARRGMRLHLLTSPTAAVFLRELPFFASITTDEPTAMRASYDAAVDFQDTFTTWRRALVLSRVKAPHRVGLTRGGFSPWGASTRVTKDMGPIHDHCWKLLAAAAGLPLTPAPFTWPSLPHGLGELGKLSKTLPEGLIIGIHVANKNPLKRMAPATTAGLVAALDERFKGRCSYVFTGLAPEAEQVARAMDAVARHLRPHCHDWSGRLGAAGLIEHIRALDMLFTVDTSVFHLAAMTETPCVGAFGPTLLNYWGPWSPYQKAASLQLACRPTENLRRTLALDDRCCPYDEPRCMTGLSAAHLMETAEPFLTDL